MEILEKQNLVNRITELFPDHTLWIKEQFNKKKFIHTRGREVLIDAPGRNLKKIVNIPSKTDPSYKIAWINVYNLCLDYLEGSINAACLENRFIQRMGNTWTLNGHNIFWPKYNKTNADYARGLEKILDEYNFVKERFINLHKKTEIKVKPSRVTLTPASDVNIKKDVKKIINLDKPEKKELKRIDRHINHEKLEEKSIENQYRNKMDHKYKKASIKSDLIIQKVSDRDILNGKDVLKLSKDTDIVVLTCMDVLNPKEEDLFIKNAIKCHEAGLPIGAFIYGKVTDVGQSAKELKICMKMLSQTNDFTGLIIYSVNNEYILKNKDSDIKLLDYINMYNAIINTLNKLGYTAMLSMNLESGKIISDINRRYNINPECEVIYITVVRDIEQISHNNSVIIVDPWNDFDVVNIKSKNILNDLNEKVEKKQRLKI